MTQKIGLWLAMLFILIIACATSLKDQDSQLESKPDPIELAWKLPPKDTLVYETVMSEIGESTFEMNLGEFFNKLNDSSKIEDDDFSKNFFDKVKKINNNSDIQSFLTNSSDFEEVINIELSVKAKESAESEEQDEKTQAIRSMMKGTMLRGSVYKNGSMHSFWIKSPQKNLISLFFELPNKPLVVGETWTLDNVNFIGNDQNFICQEALKKNTVTLSEIKKIDGETIAVLGYDIREYVSGDFKAPAFFGNNAEKKTIMDFVYKAQAEFSIDQGKWISYNGIMSLDASGIMNASQNKKFALIEN